MSIGTNGFLSSVFHSHGYLEITGTTQDSFISTGDEDNIIIHWLAYCDVAGESELTLLVNGLWGINGDSFGNMGSGGSVNITYVAPTPTPDSSEINVNVKYECGYTTLHYSKINPRFNIFNTGHVPVPLSAISLRYYYSKDEINEEKVSIHSWDFDIANIQHSFHEKYVELTFIDSSFVIEPGYDTDIIDILLNKLSSSLYVQENDYSFDPTKTEFTDWDHVTLYYNGELAWGIEPIDFSGNHLRYRLSSEYRLHRPLDTQYHGTFTT